MAGLIEISSSAIPKAKLDSVIDRAREAKSFKPIQTNKTFLDLRVTELRDLDDYLIDDTLGILIKTESKKARPELDAFWKTTSNLKGEAIFSTCIIEIAESNTNYDASNKSDLSMTTGFDFIGPSVSLAVGGISPGYKDLNCRKDIFERFINALELNDRIQVVFTDAELDIKSLDSNMECMHGMGPKDLIEIYKQGKSLYGSCYTNMNRRNFHDLSIHSFTLDELTQKIPSVLSAYGGLDKIVAYKCRFGCHVDNYPQVKNILNVSPFWPWKVSFTAKSKYTLDNLDQAIAENDSFFFSGLYHETKRHR